MIECLTRDLGGFTAGNFGVRSEVDYLLKDITALLNLGRRYVESFKDSERVVENLEIVCNEDEDMKAHYVGIQVGLKLALENYLQIKREEESKL